MGSFLFACDSFKGTLSSARSSELLAEEARAFFPEADFRSLEVADGGPGLTPEDAAVAFERGRLRERYADERPVGTGLGLSIAARLVERLGGSIAARPGEPSGAVFRIELPLPARVE